jgi:hypothetical protein
MPPRGLPSDSSAGSPDERSQSRRFALAGNLSRRCRGFGWRALRLGPGHRWLATGRDSQKRGAERAHLHKCVGASCSIFAWNLSKSSKDMLVIESADFEITGATERNCARMAKGFPKVLRTLNRDGRAWAPYWFAGDHSVTSVIKWHNRELRNLDHKSARSLHAGAWVARTRSPTSCLVQTIGAAPSYLQLPFAAIR